MSDSPTGPAPPHPTARTTAALHVAAAGYAVAHGDPIARTPTPRRRLRWTVSWQLAATAGVVVLLVAGGVALRAASVAPGPAVELPVPAPSGTVVRPTDSPAEVVVDVVGAVNAPGVVRLAEGSRVVDAIAAAGGAGPDAQLSALNLARLLVDGEQITVPRPGEQAATASGPAGGDGLLDLNGADEAALDALPGIGPVLAGRIVAHREKGPFTSVDELADVAGIGPTLLERLRELVRV
ncbi:ComEA family DNA-binding protein [Cellulomonas sp. Root137]|uniref:ComEA family DNA-binding protein n=1 Tax=Cellulomonas sp. Root137 TaxID=1736459 RepID=UPI0009E7E5F4|nr:ComEA family DNA-binding protein [Cellulomonas sp. Root137]